MSHRFATSAGMRPSNPVLTIFSVSPSFLTTAWYDSTSNPTGLVGSAASKNSIGEYSMSTQFDSSPGLMSDVGAAIDDALGATLADAGALAAGCDAAGDAVAGAPPVEQPMTNDPQASSAARRLTVELTAFLLGASARPRLPLRGTTPSPGRSHRRHLYHL